MTTASNELVLLRRDDGRVAVLTLNRPHAMNALSGELIDALQAEFDRLAKDRQIRCVIIEATGRAFSTGHDLREVASSRDYAFHHDLLTRCSAMMMSIKRLPQPVIAKVHAIATAAGCQLVAACDLTVAAKEAWFATPGVKIGLFCTTPMVALTRAIGRKRALEMLLTGQMIDARTAADWGLINHAVPAAELGSESRKLAAKVAGASSLVVALGKQAFYTQIDLDQPKAYAYAREVMSMNALAADAQEGIAAFLGKRPPCWVGK